MKKQQKFYQIDARQKIYDNNKSSLVNCTNSYPSPYDN